MKLLFLALVAAMAVVAGAVHAGEGPEDSRHRRIEERYSKWPTQAITYQLGKSRILDLRRRAEQLQAGAAARQRFHLLFMRQGTIPPGYFAEALLAGMAQGGTASDGTVRSADGVPIRYEVRGSGEPALVFVHCWACDRHFWNAQVDRFARTHTVVTLDLAGHGESGRGRTVWTIPAFAEDVKAVVDKLGLRRVVLIGHSLGGPVVLEAARRLPGRVVALVPVDTLLNVEQQEKPEEIAAFLAPFHKDFRSASEAFIRQWMFTPRSDPRLIEAVVAAAHRMPPDIAVAILETAWNYDPRPALRGLRIPIIAVNADKFPTRLEINRRYAPQFDALIQKEAGHYLMREDPAAFNALLEEALARAGADRPSK
jgi:pimeloyl-ACP methyl ester carboxylesterase